MLYFLSRWAIDTMKNVLVPKTFAKMEKNKKNGVFFTRDIILGLPTFAIIILIGYIIIKMEGTSFIFNLMIIVLISFLTWVFHLAVLYYDSMKRSIC